MENEERIPPSGRRATAPEASPTVQHENQLDLAQPVAVADNVSVASEPVTVPPPSSALRSQEARSSDPSAMRGPEARSSDPSAMRNPEARSSDPTVPQGRRRGPRPSVSFADITAGPGGRNRPVPTRGSFERLDPPDDLAEVDGARTLRHANSQSFAKSSRSSVDIVIPWRVLAGSASEAARRDSRRTSRSSGPPGSVSNEQYDVRRLAQAQGAAAQRALSSASGLWGTPPRSSHGASAPQTRKATLVSVEESPTDERHDVFHQPTVISSAQQGDDHRWDNSNPFGQTGPVFRLPWDEAAAGDGPLSAQRPSVASGDAPSVAAAHPPRRGTIADWAKASAQAVKASIIPRRGPRKSIVDMHERAKIRQVELQRKRAVQLLFVWTYFFAMVAFIYLVLVGLPLWNGAVYWLYYVVKFRFVVEGTWAVTIGVAALYAFAPLLILFEDDPKHTADIEAAGTKETALLIPCYKSARIVGPTLEAALKVFPKSQIFVIANGNSPTPLDETESVCQEYGVNHIWSPVGSKIVAQFVGCYAARDFKNVLLIDDDCALPPNFPVVGDRLTDRIKCIGYTIKSVGPDSSRGTRCQRAQDLEYKLSGLQRAFAGKIGSATFPHGAISIWDTEFLIKTFHQHPGFSISEDWFFGHAARQLGSRITMCTSIFVETETPDAVFFSSGGARGGFGEMTVFKQRFLRWNFFFVSGMAYNMWYIIRYWKLGWWEIGAKLFVFQEVYETLLYLLAPFMLPISFIVQPAFTGILFGATFGLYLLNTIIFNEVHMRLKHEMVDRTTAYVYYTLYKLALLVVNIGSCYWSLYGYAAYFAKRHPKIIEDDKAVDVVLRLEEQLPSSPDMSTEGPQARRMTVTAIGSQFEGVQVGFGGRKMTLRTIGESISPGQGAGPDGAQRRMTLSVSYAAARRPSEQEILEEEPESPGTPPATAHITEEPEQPAMTQVPGRSVSVETVP